MAGQVRAEVCCTELSALHPALPCPKARRTATQRSCADGVSEVELPPPPFQTSGSLRNGLPRAHATLATPFSYAGPAGRPSRPGEPSELKAERTFPCLTAGQLFHRWSTI